MRRLRPHTLNMEDLRALRWPTLLRKREDEEIPERKDSHQLDLCKHTSLNPTKKHKTAGRNLAGCAADCFLVLVSGLSM